MRDPSQRRPDDDRQRKRRAPPVVSDKMLRDAVRRHLLRFWPSVFQMRRVLMRRVDKSLAWHGGDRAEAVAMVDALLDQLVADGTLDDARFTRSWVRDLHRKGIARRAIVAKMATKGVDRALVHAALADLDAEVPQPELVRACAYVRRRRLGPARPDGRRPTDPDALRARREKDLAAVCRAGFSFGIAKQVIDSRDLDALMARADGDAGSTW